MQGAGEIIGVSGGAKPTLLVDPDAILSSQPDEAWRAARMLDALLALNNEVFAAQTPEDLLDLTGRWFASTLHAGKVTFFRQHEQHFRVIHDLVVGDPQNSAGGAGSLLLDAAVLDEARASGKTAWLGDAKILVAPMDMRVLHMVVVSLFFDMPSEWDVQLAACAAKLCGSALKTLQHVRRLEHAVDAHRIVLEDGIELVSANSTMQAVLGMVQRAAGSAANVLILGESGSGKELVARAIHERSSRSAGPFEAINCAAMTETLINSELFGHERGAFTGANARRIGRFERANGGTLLLDEIGEMSLNAQARLLRVLEERVVTRVGGNTAVSIDVRIVAATNRNLEIAVESGEFRKDLYYRLAVLPITVPPLRDRREDIPQLAQRLLERTGRVVGRTPDGFTEEVMQEFQRYAWPGNVRELRNAIEHAVAMGEGEVVTREDLPSYLREPDTEVRNELKLPAALRDVERVAIVAALEAAEGNKSETARTLGIDRGTLYAKLKLYSIG